jgi:8-oxo-dGTP diphosphatase
MTARRGEAAWLADYDPGAFPPFAVTVDLAIFTLRDGVFSLLLVKRADHPHRGWWALPGGHVRHGVESAADAARRELREETGVDVANVHLEQLQTYSDPARDPRIKAGLHVVSIAHVALAPDLPDPVAGTDASAAEWVAVAGVEERRLAFDHAQIVSDAVERVRAKLEYTTLAGSFVREPFSLGDLRGVYHAVWGQAPDLANFRRKVLSTPGFVEPVERSRHSPSRAGGRPPELYRRGGAGSISPPMLRR